MNTLYKRFRNSNRSCLRGKCKKKKKIKGETERKRKNTKTKQNKETLSVEGKEKVIERECT